MLKPALADALWTKLTPEAKTQPKGNVQHVLDGGALLHRVPWPRGSPTYRVVCDLYCTYVQRKYGRAIVVFDEYNEMSAKAMTQQRRVSGIGLSRLCSATFEQLLAFGATFCGFSNLEQVLPFRAIFEQNIGLEHISSTKKSTISWKISIHANFLKTYHVINLLNT